MSSGPAQAKPKNLQGKVALVTGSSRGLGREIALELASRGASVVINYAKSAGPAQDVVRQAESFGVKAVAVQADVSSPRDIENLFDKAVEAMGKIDIVMSNSGIEAFYKVEDVTPADFDRVFNINTRGQFFVAQQAWKHVTEGGRLILMSSISAQAKGVRNHALYAGSKAAVEAFARCLALDFGPKRITVNALAPGGVKSDMYRESAPKYIPGAENWSEEQVDAALAKLTPLNRVAVPADIAKVVAFLASDDGGWVNGQTLTLSGGAAM
ncbi:tetrahydroxynaphthalene reductase [Gloeophyllum trabeum ATCC 11539]|uniref:Tetrahydroxynaphthalene reductase n=1 Tax=Gloeophyllum trabeum (strain ATCC 11539 / FP-39264 / Madison 617) TaxID=670483 RepID=S7QF72_GLOTA|nr:tetrahydroxynaphthalene reductase [Gloeophyllum trabeum ATCC 11539]EPQ58012.1 tetrahydroxynaphthalene reductase [Gloeophyllum trabeum ATCC 11539]